MWSAPPAPAMPLPPWAEGREQRGEHTGAFAALVATGDDLYRLPGRRRDGRVLRSTARIGGGASGAWLGPDARSCRRHRLVVPGRGVVPPADLAGATRRTGQDAPPGHPGR